MRLFYLVFVAFAFALALHAEARAQSPALSGQVRSETEGLMEGVVVTAKGKGSTIAHSVVSDAEGRYAFSAETLSPGAYVLSIQAAGYGLAQAASTEVKAAGATANLSLVPAKNLAAQMTNAEWLESMPGAQEDKEFMLGCVSCHTLERIVQSTYDADGFVQVIGRMGTYYPGASPMKPQTLVGDALRPKATPELALKISRWLETVNRSRTGEIPFAMKTFPRLKGASTRVRFTEYDLPRREIQPHDVVVGDDGTVWYSYFQQMLLGRMDPKTGKVTEYPIPETKPGFPVGTLDLELDYEGNLWIGLMYQAAIAKFDPNTETFQVWPIPEETRKSDSAQTGHLAVDGLKTDGIVWIKNSEGTHILRFDTASETYEDLGAMTDPRTGRRFPAYGVHSDSQNNLYLLDYGLGALGKIDAKTGAFTIYPTPSKHSRPRRGHADSQDRIWFAEYGAAGNAIGMLDPSTAEVKEWKIPTPWSVPYDAVYDNNGHAWAGSMLTDRVARLNVESGEYTEYQMPRTTNIRRVFTDKKGALWIGNDHGASIVKVEVME